MRIGLTIFGLVFSFSLLTLLFVNCTNSSATPAKTTYHIKVDQFGYFPNSKKVAVIADPQIGYNANEAFNPGTGVNQYQVRRWSDDSVVFSGTLQVWNGGATHSQSGDKGWWFDFSALTTPGSYYIYDVANNIGSFQFNIGDRVYDTVLKQAMRTFFYQRINFAKRPPYTDTKWTDSACFEGANQDHYATSRFAKGDMNTAKDLSGGWMDAGDKNKYTTFALSPIVQLAEAYRMNPLVFGDGYNIPESGNGIPDILDEVKWELDFLKRMQDATGTNGFLLKVGVDNDNEVSPPSADKRARYYLPECTSSTIAGCVMFAAAGTTFKSVPALSAYGTDLITRAELAWSRAKLTTNNFTEFQTNCDDRNIKAGDADETAEWQFDNAVVAAIYLYEATNNAEYKTFAESNYTKVSVYATNWWGPYYMPQQLALLRFTTLPCISSTVVLNIRNQKAGMDYQNSINSYKNATDLYRAQMDSASYVWGHNQTRANAGNINLDYVAYNINSSRAAQYKEVAEQYVHWMHGVNPMGMVMLTNMYAYGAEKCANEIFHTWFKDGSIWDNALTSPNAPAPGYVPGGPNKKYSGPVTGITDQPVQKAYKDWNTDWPENSWEITEPAIYYQASYVSLLSRLMYANASSNTDTTTSVDTIVPTTPLNLKATNIGQTSLTLSWNASTDNVGVTGYDVYRDTSLLAINIADTTLKISALTCGTAYKFYVKAKDASGNTSFKSEGLSTAVAPCAETSIIYDDVLNTNWQDVSASCTRTYNYTATVKLGSNTLKAAYNANGTLSFSKNVAVNTTATTKIRFWVYNTGKTGLKIYTENSSGIKSSEIKYTPSSNKWEEVVISISQLGNPAYIKKVIIQSNTSSSVTFYYDQIQLTDIIETASATITGTATALVQRRTVNITKENKIINWKIYPNPVKDVLHIDVNTQETATTVIQVINMVGRLVWKKTYNTITGYNKLEIVTSSLKNGLYFLYYNSGNINKVERILIAH